jgi:hypothetical protein
MDEQHTHARRQIDRRALVRAGVWAVPVVTLATAAPAMAAVSGQTTGSLLLNSLNLYGADYDGKGKATTVESQTSVQNVWTTAGPTLTVVTLFVTYQDGKVDGQAPSLVSGTGWSFAGPAVKSSGRWQYTFLWTGTLVPSGSTPTLTWRVPLKNTSSGEVDVSAFASATGVQPSPVLAASANL